MSTKYPGGIISKTAPVPTGPFENGTAPGVWTLEQQAEFVRQGIWPLAGNTIPYVEDVFSTWLYSGTGSPITIPNGIDLAGRGGLVWIKSRSTSDYGHVLHDTARGLVFRLMTNNTNAQASEPGDLASFNSNGFTTGGGAITNDPAQTYVSWTFEEFPKFFDIVTYTGNGTGNRAIPHNLGSVPGFISTKRTSTTSNWVSYHRAVTSPNANWWRNYGYLDLPDTFIDFGDNSGLSQAPDANNIYVGSYFNASGTTYVFYLFAHNAGGFGLSGNENVISCGAYTAGSSTTTVNLGFEPQWTMIKATTTSDNWRINDNMRGVATGGIDANLAADLNNSEYPLDDRLDYNATGFTAKLNNSSAGNTYIYVAIRRGPMRVPTTGTSVFTPTVSSAATGTAISTGFRVDAQMIYYRPTNESGNTTMVDRLRSLSSNSTQAGNKLVTSNQNVETTSSGNTQNNWSNTGFGMPSYWGGLSSTVFYSFQRAPQFFDEVCYTGTGAARTVAHNLTVAPELIIYKARNLAGENWGVWVPAFGFSSGILWLNSTSQVLAFSDRVTGISATTVSTGTNPEINNSGSTYVMYLFASCPGVSKVGSYTGNGSSQTINCGFTSSARFVMVKSTNNSGNWLVVDTARGLVSAGDPTLYLNSTAAEVTGNDWIDPDSSGFIVNQESVMNANVNGANYIFLAIA